jgi:DNA-binding FadR family transcriptional regulator
MRIAYGVAMDVSGFRAVRSARTFEAVVDQLAEAIRCGELRAGDKLPAERALALRMEISRPTLREALKVLALAGVVEVLPGPTGGTFVVSESIPESLVRRTESRVAEIPAVLEARRMFEPIVARLAARRATGDDIANLRRIVALQREAVDDWPRVTQLDIRFHREIARVVGNPVIAAMMNALSRQLEIARATRVSGASSVEAAIAANDETAEAIAAGDEEELDRVMDRHLRLLEDAWSAASEA